MGVTLLDLYSGQLAATVGTLYTCPSNTRVRIVAATATNDTTIAETFTIYRVPNGDTAGDANVVINTKSLGDKESYTCPELVGHILEAGDSIQGLAGTASQITMHISGISIV
jgi:hypothetical protein